MPDELISIDEQDEIDWRNYFSEFEEKVWPMFKEKGFTFAEAYLVWRQEQVITHLKLLTDVGY